jgi:DMSO/TMAO reductase YedYZ molybdopterin-dependent catalytic subunit
MRWPFYAVALAMCVSAATARADGPPALRIDGAVMHSMAFSLADLKAMPPVQVGTAFETKHGAEKKLWTGVLLIELVKKAGLKNEDAKNAFLRHTMLVHGKDGYEVALAIGEIDPTAEAKRVIVAYSQTADLPGFRLVVPGDLHPERQVHDVVEIEIK